MASERPVWRQRYQLERRLSKRSGRHTYLARDLLTSEPVVIKLILFGPDFNWADLKLFEREAQILQTLSHPAIPQYRDCFEIALKGGRGLALVQSYIDAPSLQEWMERGRRFAEPEVRDLAQKLLRILIYLHELHPPVIHRDLKPSNILLAADGQVYLVDFGSVQAAGPREQGSYTVVGSYGYMPLEQFGGRTVPASDLYSLGATLIHLLTGQHPADLPQVGSRIGFEPAVQLSPAFRDWLRWLTEPLVANRPTSARQALEALEQLDRRPLLVPSTAAAVPPRRPAGSRIQLHKSEQTFEVVIPAKRLLGLVCLPLVVAVIALSYYALCIAASTVGTDEEAMEVSPFFLLMLACVLFGEVGWLVLLTLYSLFGKAYLYIDKERISLAYELLGLRFHPVPPSRRCYIDRLELIPGYTRRQPYSGTLEEVCPQLNIWAGNRKYELKNLQEPELEWLASELSRWLKIPIERQKG
ncbi:serine/threonine protein kinase [Synechococcus sp. H55.10]|uniref:serine/threonine protein kinase n=1 Tax=Synechococcus sp. H55.10 TaxID=2964503 RepID=UPI0039C5D15E